MIIDRATRVFFDVSSLIAAAGSPTGGSGFLLSVCSRRLLTGVVSQVVLLEADRNIQGKLGLAALQRYRTLLQTTPLLVAAVPVLTGAEPWLRIVNGKDAHVIAAALDAGATYLLTLDHGLADEVNRAGLSVRALIPGNFIRTILPDHKDFPALRS